MCLFVRDLVNYMNKSTEIKKDMRFLFLFDRSFILTVPCFII